MSGRRSNSSLLKRQNSSSAAPGPLVPHDKPSVRATLSNARPILASAVVARIWNEVSDEARSRSVCPPEMSRVRKGNCGRWRSEVVRNGVNACACWNQMNTCGI